MELNLAQTKFIGLTMKLDLKAREYKMLCDKLEKYKEEKIDENDERLFELLVEFQKNNDEILEIKRQLKEIENIKETDSSKEISHNTSTEKFNYDNIFKANENKGAMKTNETENNYNQETSMTKYKESFWGRMKRKIEEIFKSNR